MYVCVVGLVSSQSHSPCSPDRVEALMAQNTHKHKVPGPRLSRGQSESQPQKEGFSFSLSDPPLTFSADLQMNGTLCADIVSRLPNEVSNYELCVIFLCGAGCDRGKEGRNMKKNNG